MYQVETGYKPCRRFDQNALVFFRVKMVAGQEHVLLTVFSPFLAGTEETFTFQLPCELSSIARPTLICISLTFLAFVSISSSPSMSMTRSGLLCDARGNSPTLPLFRGSVPLCPPSSAHSPLHPPSLVPPAAGGVRYSDRSAQFVSLVVLARTPELSLLGLHRCVLMIHNHLEISSFYAPTRTSDDNSHSQSNSTLSHVMHEVNHIKEYISYTT